MVHHKKQSDSQSCKTFLLGVLLYSNQFDTFTLFMMEKNVGTLETGICNEEAYWHNLGCW